MANSIIEGVRNRVPYIRRLHQQIDELRHQLATVKTAPKLDAAIGSDSKGIAEQFRQFLRYLQPHDVEGFDKRRLGAPFDGGYIMLDDFAASRNALSLGIENDVSWDADMAARGYQIFQYDHSIPHTPYANPQFIFHRKRVVGRPESSDDVTLSQILSQDQLASDHDVIAKIDIEEAEWELLARTETSTLARIRQIAIEFHHVRRFVDRKWRTIMLAAMEKLTATHACIHVHGNNWSPFTVVGGIPFPNAFEATLVRRADYKLSPCSASFPTALDRPNNPKKPDLHIGCWDY